MIPTLSNTHLLLFAGLMLVVLSIVVAIRRLSEDKGDPFDWHDLVMENGRASKLACMMWGAFGLTSWMMISLELAGKMSEGYLTIYGGLWITPIVARIIKGREEPEKANP